MKVDLDNNKQNKSCQQKQEKAVETSQISNTSLKQNKYRTCVYNICPIQIRPVQQTTINNIDFTRTIINVTITVVHELYR